MDTLIMEFYKSKKYLKSIKSIADRLPKRDFSFLITGACGLIGSCLVDVLSTAGFNVYALDINEERLTKRFGEENGKLHFIAHNICDPLQDEYDFDYIVHAASFADPKSYAVYPAETILVNVLGTKNVLEYAKRHIKTRVLFTSTFEVYGKSNNDSFLESDFGLLDFNELRSCYPESKRASECLLRSYVDEYKVLFLY